MAGEHPIAVKLPAPLGEDARGYRSLPPAGYWNWGAAQFDPKQALPLNRVGAERVVPFQQSASENN